MYLDFIMRVAVSSGSLVGESNCRRRRNQAAVAPSTVHRSVNTVSQRLSFAAAAGISRNGSQTSNSPVRRSERLIPSAALAEGVTGKLISSTEVPAFIQRDDMMDQMHKWAVIEAGEGGFR